MPLPLRHRLAGLACCLLLLPLLALPSAGQTAATPNAAQQQEGYPVPITPVSGQGSPLITVWIDNNQAAMFAVDTGTPNCLISQSLFSKLRLDSYPALLPDKKPVLSEGKPVQAVTLSSLRVGGQTGSLTLQPLNVPILIVPDEKLRVSGSLTVDGIVGVNLLENFAVAFDFPRHRMTVCVPGNLTPGQAKFLGYDEAGGTVLPLSVDARDLYDVPVTLENDSISRKVNLLVDTGSQLTTIPHNAAYDLSLMPTRQLPQAGLAGSYTVNEARLHELSLGDVRLTDQLITYTTGEDRFPRLGMDILVNYKVLLDFPAKKMYLQPAVPPIKIGPTLDAPMPAKK